MSAWDRREQRIRTIAMVVIAVVAVIWALGFLRPVMIPLVLAAFLTYALAPVIDMQVNRLRVNRVVAVLTTFLLGIGVILLLAGLVGASIAAMIDNREAYERQTHDFFFGLATWLQLEPSAAHPLESIFARLRADSPISVHNVVERIVTEALDILANLLLVAIFLLFMILGKQPATGTNSEVEKSIRKYVVVKTGVAFLAALLHGGVLWLIGVEPAMVFALATFALTFIPSIGPTLAVLVPLPALPLVPDLTITGVVVSVALPMATNFATGNVLEPRLMGSSLKLHPVTILVALVFFGMVWGIVGMFMATPIVAVLKLMLDKSDTTEPFARALEGNLNALATYAHHPATESPPTEFELRRPHLPPSPPYDD